MKNDLISRSNLQEALKISDEFMGCSECESGAFLTICNLIDTAPAVDAVEVIRCKDCRFYIKEAGFCAIRFSTKDMPLFDKVSENDYCSSAKRRC